MAFGDLPISVLIVEDSLVVSSVIDRLLRSDPRIAIAHTATTAADARAYLAEHAVDVATLDLHLPDAQGAGLVAEIAAAGGCGVVVVSGSTSDHEAALALGATAVFTKPRLIEDRLLLLDGVHRAAAQAQATRTRRTAPRPSIDYARAPRHRRIVRAASSR